MIKKHLQPKLPIYLDASFSSELPNTTSVTMISLQPTKLNPIQNESFSDGGSNFSAKETSESKGIELTLILVLAILVGALIIAIPIIVAFVVRRRNNSRSNYEQTTLDKVGFKKGILSDQEVENFVKGCTGNESPYETDPDGIYKKIWLELYNSNFEISKESIFIGESEIKKNFEL